MNARQKLRELPGLLLFLIILSGLVTLLFSWQRLTLETSGYEIEFYSLRFQLWLAVTLLLLVIRLVVVRIIAAIDPKN